jgi:hypothetical protein
MPGWSKLLSVHVSNKQYITFLKWLIEVNFYNEREDRLTVKKIASDFKGDTAKITKWIHQIYEDIFELNEDKPDLFQINGIKATLHMRDYDNYGMFNLSLPILPREYEEFRFPFIKGKLGIDYFWVKRVEHIVHNDITSIDITLEGGRLNKYREFALDRAIFQGWIDYMDIYDKYKFEIDDKLKTLFISK